MMPPVTLSKAKAVPCPAGVARSRTCDVGDTHRSHFDHGPAACCSWTEKTVAQRAVRRRRVDHVTAAGRIGLKPDPHERVASDSLRARKLQVAHQFGMHPLESLHADEIGETRRCHRQQHTDDRHDDQQLDQREARAGSALLAGRTDGSPSAGSSMDRLVDVRVAAATAAARIAEVAVERLNAELRALRVTGLGGADTATALASVTGGQPRQMPAGGAARVIV